MHGRPCCVELTLPAFSTIFLYKKASPKPRPTVEKKGSAHKSSDTRRVKSGETAAKKTAETKSAAKTKKAAPKAKAPAGKSRKKAKADE